MNIFKKPDIFVFTTNEQNYTPDYSVFIPRERKKRKMKVKKRKRTCYFLGKNSLNKEGLNLLFASWTKSFFHE